MFCADAIGPIKKRVIRELEESGKIPRIEKPVFTFDGDTTDLPVTDFGGVRMAQLSETRFDANSVEKITVFVDGNTIELVKPNFWVTRDESGISPADVIFTAWRGEDVPVALFQWDEEYKTGGFAVLADPNFNAYVSRIEFAETIHPIKKEYIPWDDMPEIGPGVVDLTKYTMGDTFTSVDGAILGLFSAGGGIHSGADNNGFWDAVNTDKPITFIIDASPMGVVVTADATCYVKNTEGDLVSIEASFLVDVDGWKKVTVVFGCVDGITITVFVEPLTISGA